MIVDLEMAEQSGIVARLTQELRELSLHLQTLLAKQQRLEDDVANMRRILEVIDQVLRVDNPSMITRVFLIERQLADLQVYHARTKDWWMKLVASVSTAAILSLLGFILWLYATTKGAGLKP